ncbi:type IX secretion system ring subunit PorN/GldN [Mucilaginibacter antarcticus]|uniref:Gliding motility protein GldN n=1 Tax=Mucilaginibacter antarcticus TaxID=1855725 RepID=A0ABW5XNZ4_9SPHI
MKKGFVIVALCLASLGTFAQAKRAATKKPVTKKRVAAPTQVGSAGAQQSTGTSLVPAVANTALKPDTIKPFEKLTDGYYVTTDIEKAVPTPYHQVRQADIIYKKRIWREIDLREKMNQFMASPKGRLIDALMDAISTGELTAFDPTPTKDDPNGDSGWSNRLTAEQAKLKLSDSSRVDIFNANGEKTGTRMAASDFQADSVIKFRIKEDWIFDKQRSVWEPRIIGIAPMVRPNAGDGVTLDYQPAFWIYFLDARKILATKTAFNHNNDATNLSLDDVFLKRLFASYIVKESNDKDERIRDYAEGIDRLYEAERIKKGLMDWELNLWQY